MRSRSMAATFQRNLLLWLPVTLFASYIGTFLICISQSIAAYGGNTCGPRPCDLSVYGASPKNGPQFVTFRTGFTLMGLQLVLLTWARFSPMARGCAFWTKVSCFVTSICCLMVMAYIPYWQSPVHFFGAVFAYVFMGIGASVDATQSVQPYRCARWVILALTTTFFAGWVVSPGLVGYPISILQYIATILPFAYFFTWSIQVANTPKDPTDDNSPSPEG